MCDFKTAKAVHGEELDLLLPKKGRANTMELGDDWQRLVLAPCAMSPECVPQVPHLTGEKMSASAAPSCVKELCAKALCVTKLRVRDVCV